MKDPNAAAIALVLIVFFVWAIYKGLKILKEWRADKIERQSKRDIEQRMRNEIADGKEAELRKHAEEFLRGMAAPKVVYSDIKFTQPTSIPVLIRVISCYIGTGNYDDLLYVWKQVDARGYVANEDIRQYAGRGVPIYKYLSQVSGIPESEINQRLSRAYLGSSYLDKAIIKMTSVGEIFGPKPASTSSSNGNPENGENNNEGMNDSGIES